MFHTPLFGRLNKRKGEKDAIGSHYLSGIIARHKALV